MEEPHVQIIVDGDPVPLSLKTALNRVGARVSIRSLSKAAHCGLSPSTDVCIILPKVDHAPDLLERIVCHASDRACATMVLHAAPIRVPAPQVIGHDESHVNVAVRRLAAPETSNVLSLNADELTGRLKALCDIRRPLRRLQAELDQLRKIRHAGDEAVQSLDDQLRLAGQVQTDLLPEPLADTHPLSISTLYLPAEYVSGDIYDIARLDETHIGFSIADATGHGLPAALLTFLIKRSLRGKEIFNNTYRIVEPDELLVRLNEDLIQAPLSQCQFVTALHAVFDSATGSIRWARGGFPYPILVREGQPARLLFSEGGLIGAFDQHFEVVSHSLERGDTLVFYSDGLDALLLHPTENSATTILETDWVRLLEREGVEPALSAIRDRVAAAGKGDWHEDDITVIALHMN